MAVSVLTFGVSTERGTVHAVALTCPGDGPDGTEAAKLPDRVVVHRTREVGEAADLGVLVAEILAELADEVGPDSEIAGTAVTYRDSAQRRAIVTALAGGRWHDASLVSARSAHLSLAGALAWADDFDHLMVCEVSPGYQAFTVVSPDRDRVLATFAAACPAVTETALRPVVTAARDQLEAEDLRPDAVVLVGSAAPEAQVAAALNAGFTAPVIKSRMAASAAAIGAALVVQPEPAAAAGPGGRRRAARGSTALFAAAGVLAGGLVVGGAYQMSVSHRSVEPVTSDPQVAAENHRVLHQAPEQPETRPEGDQSAPTAIPAPGTAADPSTGAGDTETVTVDPSGLPWNTGRNATATGHGRWPMPLKPERAGADAGTPATDPGAGSPDPGTAGTNPGAAGTDSGTAGTNTGAAGTDSGTAGTNTGAAGADSGAGGADTGAGGTSTGAGGAGASNSGAGGTDAGATATNSDAAAGRHGADTGATGANSGVAGADSSAAGSTNADAMVMIPAAQSSVAADTPGEGLLFPGETAPPTPDNPEFGHWLDNHWRMTMQAVLSAMPRT
ncbi:hypothetical protein [Nocardia sp. alder85J]|uniref:hypothetical protein n=1 Tax=Nocardia sp. alder85J TaxID=2862949 RepID=UPI001CD6F665|nr:hypothetical protein [Nocardia sp. alder85J]MCX4097947.1 hypothetical protein [Nocardia sp. alder85J]